VYSYAVRPLGADGGRNEEDYIAWSRAGSDGSCGNEGVNAAREFPDVE